MQFHQLSFLQWHLDVCWNSPPSHTIPNYTQHCKSDNISYIHAHAQMVVIYTYFSASFNVVAQDEDTKMYFIFQLYLLYKKQLLKLLIPSDLSHKGKELFLVMTCLLKCTHIRPNSIKYRMLCHQVLWFLHENSYIKHYATKDDNDEKNISHGRDPC